MQISWRVLREASKSGRNVLEGGPTLLSPGVGTLLWHLLPSRWALGLLVTPTWTGFDTGGPSINGRTTPAADVSYMMICLGTKCCAGGGKSAKIANKSCFPADSLSAQIIMLKFLLLIFYLISARIKDTLYTYSGVF